MTTTIPEPCAITVPADPDVLLQAARDALKARVAALTERETDLRNQLDQVIGDRTIATGRLTDLDNILGPAAPAPSPATRIPARPAKPAKPGKGKTVSPTERATSDDARARWTPVFDWVTASKADGTYTIAGLVERFGSWAKNWAAYAKAFGVTITPPTPPHGPASCSRGTSGRARSAEFGGRHRSAAPRVQRMRRHLPDRRRRPAEQPLPPGPRPRVHRSRTHTRPRLTP